MKVLEAAWKLAEKLAKLEILWQRRNNTHYDNGSAQSKDASRPPTSFEEMLGLGVGDRAWLASGAAAALRHIIVHHRIFRKLPLVGHTFTHDSTDGGPIVGVIDVIEKIQELFAVRNSSPVRGLLKCLWSCTDVTFVFTVLRKLPGKRNEVRGTHHAVSSE